MRGLTRSPAAGSVVRWSTVKTSTLATISSGMETTSRRTANCSMGRSRRRALVGGRWPPTHQGRGYDFRYQSYMLKKPL
jgi:hypothetical protein